ncbi:ABC transporter ATP-binding protein [Salipiger abyssi]|uniref:ABC transporter ATP-binding protein n=1 Tax=Salipiger abyssi TaxID=1250539 RepID=UPI001A909698|nr:ABC transporter ATP-binding protein [Salipiger abyssi]MBN9887188.1 ABC transporter ATP-binding protein [Salipiger abyssi]
MLLDIRNLEIEIGPRRLIRGVSLNMAAGETLCIVGESGSGKSLTALALMGLLPRSARWKADRMQILGTDYAGNGAGLEALRGARLGMIFQDPMTSLNPSFTIGNQLRETVRLHRGLRGGAATAACREMLDHVGIDRAAHRMSQYPHELSGGLRQRVMIALALLCAPDILIADEPTTALDVTIQAQILALLKELQREMGMGLLFITHDLGVVSEIGDRAAIMYAGEIVETGPVERMLTHPQSPYAEALMRCLPSLDLPSGGRLGTIPGHVADTLGLRGCGFAQRCAYARPACFETGVPFVETGPASGYRCLFAPGAARVAKEAANV